MERFPCRLGYPTTVSRMTDRYAIDIGGFLDLAGATSRSLDDLTSAVSAAVQALWAIRDAISSAPELSRGFDRATGPWEAKACGLVEYAGALLEGAEQAVTEYCRADVVMALNADQSVARQGTGRWRVA